MRTVLRVIGVVLMLLALLAAVLLIRVSGYEHERPPVQPGPEVTLRDGAPERMARAIRIPTISHQDPARLDSAAFRAFHGFVATAFPLAHAALERERVNGFSLLYTWSGSDPSRSPVVLMGHMDVVPVEPGTEDAWQQPPFSGRIEGGYIWGRGAMDDKVSVLSILEAVETLLADGFEPSRTIYLAFGHDEEVGGRQGARAIAELLSDRGVRPGLVLDEGGFISSGIIEGIPDPVALVGVAEKGYLSVELVVEAEGGHSSMPPDETAAGIVAAAVTRLQRHPMPARLAGATRLMFDRLGPEFDFGRRLVFANLWLFEPLVTRMLAGSPTTNAAIRTTTAPTMLQGSPKDNVLPSRATAVVNFRILPGDSVEGVLDRVRRVVDDDRVQLRALGFRTDPSPVSRTDDETFGLVRRTIREVEPEALVTPYLVVGGTDARYYAGLSDHVYRFLPVRATQADLSRVHGTNERIGVEDYLRSVEFYVRLLRNSG